MVTGERPSVEINLATRPDRRGASGWGLAVSRGAGGVAARQEARWTGPG